MDYLTDHGPSRRKDIVEFLQGAGISFDSAVWTIKTLVRQGTAAAVSHGTYSLVDRD